jgi:oligopeptide/dipeptide ABC transporter ATP-binding protein
MESEQQQVLQKGGADYRHLLEVKNLRTYFHVLEGTAKAVDGLSINLSAGEVLGVVGESGCGKSVTALSVMRLLKSPPARIEGGEILYKGRNLLELSRQEMRSIRGKRISMIFQEPMTSLNPVYTIGEQISEILALHEGAGREESRRRAIEMLEKVQIPSAAKRYDDYPHQLSGGMRQRAMIAMALACNPEILIADEPTTALDVTVQAQIIDLMMQLKEEYSAAIMLITHDLGVVAQTAGRIVVMYAGKAVEEAGPLAIFEEPKHPYTRGLLKSIPRMEAGTKGVREPLHEIHGIVPSLLSLPKGCSFHPRCPSAMDLCRQAAPGLTDLGDCRVRCHLYEQS